MWRSASWVAPILPINGCGSFDWGLSFFYGRSVFTAIEQQPVTGTSLRRTVLGLLAAGVLAVGLGRSAFKLRPNSFLTNRGGRRFNVAMPAKKSSATSHAKPRNHHLQALARTEGQPPGDAAGVRHPESHEGQRLPGIGRANGSPTRTTTSSPRCVLTARPHTMVVWGIWLDNAYYFSTGSTTRKAKNLAANPNCVVCNENVEEAVIVEGQARQLAVSGNSRSRVRSVSEEIRLEARSRDGPGLQSHAASGLCHAGKAVSRGCDPLACSTSRRSGISHSEETLLSGAAERHRTEKPKLRHRLESVPPRAHRSGRAAAPRDSRGRDNSGYSP